MSTTLIQDLATGLNSYSTYVNYWSPGAGDSHIMLGHREFLQRHVAELSDDQRKQLIATDQRVIELAGQSYTEADDDDVQILLMCADLIKKHQNAK
jgi:hypothetical protein